MMTPIQSFSRVLRALVAALVVAAAVAGAAYGVTRSTKHDKQAGIPAALSLSEVSDQVASLGEEPADLPTTDGYTPPTLKVFVAPKPRIVVRETQRAMVQKAHEDAQAGQQGSASDESEDPQPPDTSDAGDGG